MVNGICKLIIHHILFLLLTNYYYLSPTRWNVNTKLLFIHNEYITSCINYSLIRVYNKFSTNVIYLINSVYKTAVNYLL